MPPTSNRLYFENAVGRLSEHPDGYALVQYASGKRSLGDFQAFLTHLGHLLRRRGWYKVLADQRQMLHFTQEEQRWLREQWLAQSPAADRGMVAAVLLTDDAFASLAPNGSREGALVYHVFRDETEAARWLRQVA